MAEYFLAFSNLVKISKILFYSSIGIYSLWYILEWLSYKWFAMGFEKSFIGESRVISMNRLEGWIKGKRKMRAATLRAWKAEKRRKRCRQRCTEGWCANITGPRKKSRRILNKIHRLQILRKRLRFYGSIVGMNFANFYSIRLLTKLSFLFDIFNQV